MVCTSRVPSFETKALAEALPTLVAWRLRVFYAPHYSLLDFPIQKLQDKGQARERGTTPESRALYSAGELLEQVSVHLSKLDVKAVARSYGNELNQDASHGHLYKAKSPANQVTERPVTKIIKRVSVATGIPERQLSRSLLLLAQHEQFTAQEVTSTSDFKPPSSTPTITPTTPKHLADKQDYKTLSKLILEDTQDIHYFKIFESNSRYLPSNIRDVHMYRQAVRQCAKKYFSTLEYVKRNFKASADTPRWVCDVDKYDLRVEKRASGSIGRLFSRFCIAVDTLVRGPKFISFEHRWMIMYELSQSEIDRYEELDEIMPQTGLPASFLTSFPQTRSISENSLNVKGLLCRCHSARGRELSNEVTAERAMGVRRLSRWSQAKKPEKGSITSLRSDPDMVMSIPLPTLEENVEYVCNLH